jgi:hypothetical protein
VWWGESDEGLTDTVRRLKARGIQSMLKPHIWIRHRGDGRWRGEIAFETEAEWDLWWDRYRAFALHYAELAEANAIPLYCIGTELRSTVLMAPDRWRDLIREVRGVYGGALTYSANWYREFQEVPFWDDLDYIGIQAYFPLTSDEGPEAGLDALVAGWAGHVADIEQVQRRCGKPVILTEIGYRSTRDAAVEPWQWRSEVGLDNALQARCYEAMFRSFWDRPWFAGLYVWKWFPDDRVSRRRGLGFTPQGKPAERVLRAWYSGRTARSEGPDRATEPPVEADEGRQRRVTE